MKYLSVIAFVISCVPAVAQSVPQPPVSAIDYIILEGRSVQIPAAVTGSGVGGVHWLRTTGSGTTFITGVERFSMAGSRWTVGNAGVAFRPRDRIVLHAQARIGGGRRNSVAFDHRMYEAGMAYRAVPRLHLTVDQQYWHVGSTRGHLIKPGLSLLPLRRLSVDMTYMRSAGGNLDAKLGVGRFGLAIGSVTILGGAAHGKSAPELFDLMFSAAAERSLNEKFAGIQIRLPRAQVAFVGSDLRVASVHKRTLTASIKYQIRAK